MKCARSRPKCVKSGRILSRMVLFAVDLHIHVVKKYVPACAITSWHSSIVLHLKNPDTPDWADLGDAEGEKCAKNRFWRFSRPCDPC